MLNRVIILLSIVEKYLHLFFLLVLIVAAGATPLSADSLPEARPVPGLTAEEMAWLKDHPDLTIAPSPDFPPIEFFDKNGNYRGITAEYVAILERKLGIRFTILRLSSWREIMERTEKGDVDIWGAATETPKRASLMRFTQPYLNFSAAIIVKEGLYHDLALDKLGDLKIVSPARYVIDDYLSEHYPDLKKIQVPDVATGLKMVSLGVADAIVVNEAAASYHTHELGLTNLAIAGQSDEVWPLSFASRRQWPELNSILEKTLASIDPGERKRLQAKWVNLKTEGYISHRTFWLTLLGCIGAGIIAVGVVLLLNRSLRRMVMERTIELQNQLSDRRRIENELLKSKERLSRFFDAASEGIFFHVEGKIVDVNPAATEIFGYSVEEIIGRDLLSFVTPDSRPQILERMKSDKSGAYEVTGVTRSGERVFLDVRSRSADAENTRMRVAGFRDITLRKRIENDLRTYQEELEAKTESLEAIRGIADKLYRSLDLDSVAEQAVHAMINRANSPSVAIFLLDEDGSHLDMLFSHGFDGALLKKAKQLPIRGSLSGLAVESRQVVISRDISTDSRLEPVVAKGLLDNGYCSAITVPLLAEDKVLGVMNLLYPDYRKLASTLEEELLTIGQTIGLAVSHALNVTHLHKEMSVRRSAEKQLQQLNEELEARVKIRTAELAQAKEQAEKADRLKSAFLATMSHELRTPLNSIIGFAGILQQELPGPLNEEQKKQLAMLRNSARHLLDLINDVLDLSKIEADQLTLSCTEFDLRETVQRVYTSMKITAESKGLNLAMDISPEVGVIRSDQRRVEQILLNLIGNAVKFTDKGDIAVTCRVNDGSVQFAVADSGIGIREEDLGSLFKPFRQLESGLSRRFEGTGLGLCICRKLVERLGGDIWVESSEGKGSTFSFSLPNGGNPT